MLQEYPTTRCTRTCHASGKTLEPGETYVSALIAEGDNLVRLDFSSTHWSVPPENTIGWWRCQMPKASQTRLRPAPNGILLDTLAELLRTPEHADLAYMLALVLVRRRVLRDDHQETPDVWQLTNTADGGTWQIPIAMPSTPEKTERLKQSLKELLFTEE